MVAPVSPTLPFLASFFFFFLARGSEARALASAVLYSRKTNHQQGYPQEWFPSVSATIGDRYPERSVFQIFIALTSGTSKPNWITTTSCHWLTGWICRTSFRTGFTLVFSYRTDRFVFTKIYRFRWSSQNAPLWWMGVHHLNGRP